MITQRTLAGAALLSLVAGCTIPPAPHPDPANWPQISESSAEWKCAGPATQAALDNATPGIIVPIGAAVVFTGNFNRSDRAARTVRKECLASLGWLP